ncbi:hypothetical protein OJ997_34180 [Solirubrobacter phytolaccae]|uniref:Uncharacterized protein n=1 Tax=Solirubrobacter phytolaccae TaxID=1404360 RepID=A0A9X3SEW6_9ACTN|nr:hypothetical protein [Solirubrobacter phytolaccae]MDA0185405.1 hypothetical protein [Solirubrobacter phytolaccae]
MIVVIAIAIFVTAVAWMVVPGLVVTLAIHLASPVDDDPTVPNNPLKFWLFVLGACSGLVLIVLGASSTASYAIIGAVLLSIL